MSLFSCDRSFSKCIITVQKKQPTLPKPTSRGSATPAMRPLSPGVEKKGRVSTGQTPGVFMLFSDVFCFNVLLMLFDVSWCFLVLFDVFDGFCSILIEHCGQDCMPLTHSIATRLGKKLTDVRKSGELWWLRPDGKTQVTIEHLGWQTASSWISCWQSCWILESFRSFSWISWIFQGTWAKKMALWNPRRFTPWSSLHSMLSRPRRFEPRRVTVSGRIRWNSAGSSRSVPVTRARRWRLPPWRTWTRIHPSSHPHVKKAHILRSKRLYYDIYNIDP